MRRHADQRVDPRDVIWWTFAQLRDLEIDHISPEILRAVVAAVEVGSCVPVLEGEWYELALQAQRAYRNIYG